MLDINFIRENPEKVKKGVREKGYDEKLVDEVLELDEKRRALLQKLEAERAEKNKIAEEYSKKKTKELLQRGKIVKAEIHAFEGDLSDIEQGLKKALYEIPNLPSDDVPIEEDKVLRKWGKPPKFDFEPSDYETLSEVLNIVDVKRAAKVSGSRFSYLISDGALLEFALVQYALQVLTKGGFTPIVPPVLIKPKVKRGLGYMEHGAHESWYLVGEPEVELQEPNFYLIGTAEHAIVPFHKDEILEEKTLPKRYVGFSAAFRREAGTYGKDTKGIFRVHQFDKVEMVSFTKPEDSPKEHEYLLSMEEKLMRGLKLPYRVVQINARDMAFPTARQFDIETWFPSEGKYRETHSTSNITDFQARRLDIKYRTDGKTEYVHTLNGTAFAIGRTIIAILENFQQKDGSVVIPDILRDWVGKDKITPP